MPADLTREEVERLDDEYQHTGWVSLADAVRLLQHALSEPVRLASARQEGYREGVEAARQVALHWLASLETDRDRATSTLAHAEAAQMNQRVCGIAIVIAGIDALSPAPAEPTGMTADGWIEWKGGECPVQDGVETHAKMRDGVIGRSLEPRGWCGWQHDPKAPGLDIVAYRIVKPAEPSDPGVPDEDGPRDEAGLPMFMRGSDGAAEPSAPEARMARAKAVQEAGIRRYLKKRIAALEAENAALLGKLERCASVAEGASASFDFQSAIAECRDHDVGYHSGRVAAAKDVRALLQGGPDAG